MVPCVACAGSSVLQMSEQSWGGRLERVVLSVQGKKAKLSFPGYKGEVASIDS